MRPVQSRIQYFARRKYTMMLSLLFQLKGTVILRIWWQVLLVVAYTTGLVACIKYFKKDWGSIPGCPQPLIPIFGVATALLLVFRTNTAYDRYWEGRNLWSKLTLNIRNLSRCIWVMVDDEKDGNGKDIIIIEKRSVLRLLVAFAYATRNYLREEYSYDEIDLQGLVGHLPNFRASTRIAHLEGHEGKKRKVLERCSFKAFDIHVPTNIPIEISHYIASYIDSVRRRELVDSSTAMAMNTALNNLVDSLGGFERILRTPIPLAYSIHLHQATWLYLLTLPFQLSVSLEWYTVPAAGLAAFALLGILAIGREIENPFGYDDNDLPLDDFCKVIRTETENVIGLMNHDDDHL